MLTRRQTDVDVFAADDVMTIVNLLPVADSPNETVVADGTT